MIRFKNCENYEQKKNEPYVYERTRELREIKPLLNKPTDYLKDKIISLLNNMSSSEINSLYKKLYKGLRKERKRVERNARNYGQ